VPRAQVIVEPYGQFVIARILDGDFVDRHAALVGLERQVQGIVVVETARLLERLFGRNFGLRVRPDTSSRIA
jgi:hypothetical protein